MPSPEKEGNHNNPGYYAIISLLRKAMNSTLSTDNVAVCQSIHAMG